MTQQSSERAWPSPTIRVGVLALLATLLVLPLVLAPPGEAYVYWATLGNSIGRANLDGRNAHPSFIRGAGEPGGIAVDASHLYWANLDTIGRADLDGTNAKPRFIRGASRANGVAVDANHVYWTNLDAGTVGRANLGGTGAEQSFITGASEPVGVAVDAVHVYWTNTGTNSIGRANLDGTNVNHSFIGVARSPNGVAVDAGHVYWTNFFENTIGRVDLDGTNVNQSFIGGTGSLPYGVAVDALKPPGKATAEQTQTQQGRKIRVTVNVRAEEDLTGKASGKIKVNPTYKLTPKKVQVAAGETKTLKLKPKTTKAKKIAAALKRGEKATARLTVKLTDPAGNTETEELRVRLKRG